MGVTTLFDIASSGITAQRLALEVTGENIANVNTQGYSRQQVLMETRPVTSMNGFPLGTGAEIQQVRRSYDAMLQQQTIDSNSSYQQSLAKQTALDEIQPSFNELATNGLGAALDNFFGSFSDLATNPQGVAERQSLLTNSQQLVDTFHQVSQTLATAATTADNGLVGITADVTSNARDLALVNLQIKSSSAVGGNPNELLDKRDLLLQQLSEKIGITSTLQSDGTATVTLAGGQQLVNSATYATLYTNPNGATPSRNNIMVTGLGNPPPATAPATDTNVTATVGGTNNGFGQLGGTLQVRDTIVPGYQSKLDEMAATLVGAVNTQHAAGYALDGSTGNNFFAPAGTTAATIALATGLTATKIAAGSPTASDPAPTKAGNNLNALSLAAIKNTSYSFSVGSTTFDGFYNNMVSQVGLDTRAAQNTSTQQAAYLKQLGTLRASNSGVSLDEELTNLTKYQQAFQGSAKVINVATQMLDTILGMVR